MQDLVCARHFKGEGENCHRGGMEGPHLRYGVLFLIQQGAHDGEVAEPVVVEEEALLGKLDFPFEGNIRLDYFNPGLSLFEPAFHRDSGLADGARELEQQWLQVLIVDGVPGKVDGYPRFHLG